MLQREMTKSLDSVSRLSDQELLAEVKIAAAREREATARLIALLAQLDERRLYLGEGCSSLFTYCTQVLHLSEHAAYGRIEAARAARRFPVILDLLGDGSVTLTTVTLLAPHLTPTTTCDLLNEARHKSKRDVEHIVARLRPQPAVPATVRKLPEPKPHVDPVTPPVVESTAERRSGSRPRAAAPAAPRHRDAARARALQGAVHRVAGDARQAAPRAGSAAALDPERRSGRDLRSGVDGAAGRSRAGQAGRDCTPARGRPVASGSRHIPAAVRREVWKRDDGQCAFVGTEGRCTERGFLEFHHVQPYADGGAAVVENLELRCRAHNLHEAEQYFGSRLPLLVREESTWLRHRNPVRTRFDVRRQPASH